MNIIINNLHVKFHKNVGKTFHVGVIFTYLLIFPKVIQVLFLRGGNFRE